MFRLAIFIPDPMGPSRTIRLPITTLITIYQSTRYAGYVNNTLTGRLLTDTRGEAISKNYDIHINKTLRKSTGYLNVLKLNKLAL